MARFDNPFALLSDEDDGTSVAATIERIAAEKSAADQKAVEDQKAATVVEQKPAFNSENGRGRGRGGHGLSRGGRGGRGYVQNGKQFYGYNGNQRQFVGYSGNQRPFYGYNGYQRQNGDDLHNGTEVQEKDYNVHVNRNENGNNNGGTGYGRSRGDFGDGERRRFDSHDGGRNERSDRNQLENNKKKEHYVDNADQANNGHGASESQVHENAEVPKAVEPEKVLPEQEQKQLSEKERMREEQRERLRKEMEEDAKKLTLRQYEKELLQRRKALEDKLKKLAEEKKTTEGLKTEDRKVVLEKKFEGNPVILKKKEDHFIQPKSDKEKLKRKGSLEKEEKIRKAIIPNFQYPKPERKKSPSINGHERSQNDRNGIDYKGGLSGLEREEEPVPKPKPVPLPPPAPKIEDNCQFPGLSISTPSLKAVA